MQIVILMNVEFVVEMVLYMVIILMSVSVVVRDYFHNLTQIVMDNVMKNLEAGGQISEESQGQGAQRMYDTMTELETRVA